jgi:hypothetical protein
LIGGSRCLALASDLSRLELLFVCYTKRM